MFVEAASVIAKNGFMFKAVTGTECPEDWEDHDLVEAATGTDPFPGWEFLGATSLENLPEPGNDGGDTDVKGSWDGLLSRQVQTAASIDYLTINPYQFDKNIMDMYWGQGTYDPATKIYTVTNVGGTPLESAFMIIIADGPVRVGIHSWKASYTRDDAFALSTEDYTEWPVRVTWLNQAGSGMFQMLGVSPAGATS